MFVGSPYRRLHRGSHDPQIEGLATGLRVVQLSARLLADKPEEERIHRCELAGGMSSNTASTEGCTSWSIYSVRGQGDSPLVPVARIGKWPSTSLRKGPRNGARTNMTPTGPHANHPNGMLFYGTLPCPRCQSGGRSVAARVPARIRDGLGHHLRARRGRRQRGVTTWWGGAVTGAVVWVAIGALTSADTILCEDRPVGLRLLFSSYQLVVLTIAGVLFALWR